MAIIDYAFRPELTESFLSLSNRCRGGSASRAHESEIRRLFHRDGFFHQGAGNRHRNFAATLRGQTVGHVTSFVHRGLQQSAGAPVGGVGFFDCVDDHAVARDLLDAAVGWLREEAGATRVYGPIQFDIWHGYRFKTDGFRDLSFAHEPDNPDYYPAFFERNGFHRLRSWTSLVVERSSALDGALARQRAGHEAIADEGYSFAPVSNATDLHALHGLLSHSFQGLTAYTRPSFGEFQRWFHGRFRDPRIVLLARDSDDAPAAFALAYADLADATRRPGARAVFMMLGTRKNEAEAAAMLAPALVSRLIEACLEGGYDEVVLALMSKTSRAQGAVATRLARAHCDYALYERAA